MFFRRFGIGKKIFPPPSKCATAFLGTIPHPRIGPILLFWMLDFDCCTFEMNLQRSNSKFWYSFPYDERISFGFVFSSQKFIKKNQRDILYNLSLDFFRVLTNSFPRFFFWMIFWSFYRKNPLFYLFQFFFFIDSIFSFIDF